MSKLFRVIASIMVVGLLLSGCSSLPGLRMPSTSVGINGTDIPTLIQSAQAVQSEYATQIGNLSTDVEDHAKFNIIDGTALAAASIYHGNRNVLSFFGLAGGANIAIDSTFNPSVQLNTYESGYNAISCMIEKAQALPAAQSNVMANIKNRNNLLSNAKASFQVVAQAKIAASDGNTAESPQPAPPNEAKVNDALLTEYQKADRILDAAENVDTTFVFRTNLTNLHHMVRKKLRDALKAQQPTMLRDQLIANAVAAEKNRDQSKATESAIKALNGARSSPNSDMNTLASLLGSAADIAAFDSDLKKCLASSGF